MLSKSRFAGAGALLLTPIIVVGSLVIVLVTGVSAAARTHQLPGGLSSPPARGSKIAAGADEIEPAGT